MTPGELHAALREVVATGRRGGYDDDEIAEKLALVAHDFAAGELRAAADWLARGAAGRPGPLRLVARKLDDRADALAADDRAGQR